MAQPGTEPFNSLDEYSDVMRKHSQMSFYETMNKTAIDECQHSQKPHHVWASAEK
jgi:hypothetical protein